MKQGHGKALAVLMATAGGIAAICMLLFRAEDHEPKYRERPLSAWVDDLATGSSKEIREAAEETVKHAGADAIPYLLRLLATRDTIGRRLLLSLKKRQKLVTISVMPANEQRYRAVLGFEVLGPTAKPAIPKLQEMLLNDPEPGVIADALAAVGPDAVPAILSMVEKVPVRFHCALYGAALKCPSRAGEITEALVKSISSADHGERHCAAEFLGRLRGPKERVIPALIQALQDPDFSVRTAAVSSLRQHGTNALPAVGALRGLLRDPSFPSNSVAEALLQIEGH